MKGFTLIELLVVMIIIAILTIMAIPMYNGFRINARNTAALSDLRNLRGMLENYYAAYLAYPTGLFEGDDASSGVWNNPGGSNKGKVMNVKLRPSTGVQFYYQVDKSREAYVIATKHEKGNRIYATTNLMSVFLQYEDNALIGTNGADSGVTIPKVDVGTTDNDIAQQFISGNWQYVNAEPAESEGDVENNKETE